MKVNTRNEERTKIRPRILMRWIFCSDCEEGKDDNVEVALGSRASTWESDRDVAAECTLNVLVVSKSLVVEAAS